MLSNCVRFTWKYCTTNLNILTFYIVVRAREYHRQHTYKNPFLLRVYNLLIALEFDSDRALTIKESFGKPLFSPSFKSFCRNHYNAPCRFTVRFEGLHIVCLLARACCIRMYIIICIPIGSHYSCAKNLTVIVRNFKIWIQLLSGQWVSGLKIKIQTNAYRNKHCESVEFSNGIYMHNRKRENIPNTRPPAPNH